MDRLFQSHVWLSILDDAWPEVPSVIQRWLADNSFDDAGRSHQSLREDDAATVRLGNSQTRSM
jgi:hypothetical protein